MPIKRKLPKDVPYHTESLWALIRAVPSKDSGLKTDMMYLFAPTRHQLWTNVVESEFFGSGHTKKSLQELGFVAREVVVEEVAL